MGPYRHHAFGLTWSADIPLNGFSPADDDGPIDVVVRRGAGDPPARGDGITINRGVIYPDGVRFTVGGDVTLDMYRGDLVEWRPGPDWTGELPLPFFSTVTAMLLAWRGAIPIHGSAVEIDGRGVMICGRSGNGKSSLAAGLIAAGGRLISDDLSVILPACERPMLVPGRPAIRLHRDTVAFLPEDAIERPAETTDAKTLTYPRRIADDQRVALDTVIVLVRLTTGDSKLHAAPLLGAQVFRPRWLASLHGVRERRAALTRVAPQVRMIEMAPPEIHDRDSFHAAAAAVLAAASG